ncbi:Melanoma-associated antigen D2 [Nymphon striatum]|nr:Melanoma-associated antigen D2 [Nymphon striatum]
MLIKVIILNIIHSFHFQANDVVYYVLVIDQKKIPFKRTDINKNVLKEHSSMFTIILKEAKSILDSTFGIELIEVPDKRGTYFLANKLFVDDENSHLMWSQEENTKTGLLFIILSLIFMNGNIIQDS